MLPSTTMRKKALRDAAACCTRERSANSSTGSLSAVKVMVSAPPGNEAHEVEAPCSVEEGKRALVFSCALGTTSAVKLM